MFVPQTMEGRAAWLFMVIAFVVTAAGLAVVIRSDAPDVALHPTTQNMFPFAALLAISGLDFWDIPIFVAALQFPAYAVLLLVALAKRRFGLVLLVIALVHAALAVICRLSEARLTGV